jgi:excisionase family DNA binding protein
MTPEQINFLFQELQNQIIELKQFFEPKTATEYLTRKEAADFLKCDLSTIHNWTKKRRLKSYGIGNRVYYKRSEIESALVLLD